MTAPVHVDAPPPPPLWNPNAAALWSLLFSPAFGAFLHARNAEALGRTEEAKANRFFFRGTLAFVGLVTLVGVLVPRLPDSVWTALSRGGGIGVLVGWYLSVGSKQIRYVKETWHDAYPRRPWTRPLLVAVACFFAYFIAIVLLILVADAILGAPPGVSSPGRLAQAG
jgi:hypothetical protein